MELLIFENNDFGKIRMVEINGQPYAVAIDIATALGYSNPSKAVIMHCKNIRKEVLESHSQDGKVVKTETNLITEGDIYRLIVKAADQSRNYEIKEKAERFERWLFDEVMPTIRKTGGYVANEDLFINTYLPFADENTKAMFRGILEVIRNQNLIIENQKNELEHKKEVISALTENIDLATKRQIINRIVRKAGANYKQRWDELYKQFEMKFHIDIDRRLKSYNLSNRPKIKNKLDYIDKVLNKIPELYEIACKLYESDVQELINELYKILN